MAYNFWLFFMILSSFFFQILILDFEVIVNNINIFFLFYSTKIRMKAKKKPSALHF